MNIKIQFRLLLIFAAILLMSVCHSNAAEVVAAKTNSCDAFRVELERMLETDQKLRNAMWGASQEEQKRLWVEQNAIDASNLKRLIEIAGDIGWPKTSECGKSAASAAFLIAQHSPLETMKRFYPMVQQAMLDGELPKGNFALYEDRVRMYEKRPQLYGTQLQGVTTDGAQKMEIWTIEDEANVDKRRAEMGLGPLAEYAKHFGVTYVPISQRLTISEKPAP